MKIQRYDANISFSSLQRFPETNGVCRVLLYCVQLHNDQLLEFLKLSDKTIFRSLVFCDVDGFGC